MFVDIQYVEQIWLADEINLKMKTGIPKIKGEIT